MIKLKYEYKDGRFLKTNYIGDGEYELILTKKLDTDCLFNRDWELSEILLTCDSVYSDTGEFIAETLDIGDFSSSNVKVTIS
jgi:hypothetical protein